MDEYISGTEIENFYKMDTAKVSSLKSANKEKYVKM